MLLRRIGQDTGIHVHAHKFRNTFATRSLAAGVDHLRVAGRAWVFDAGDDRSLRTGKEEDLTNRAYHRAASTAQSGPRESDPEIGLHESCQEHRPDPGAMAAERDGVVLRDVE